MHLHVRRYVCIYIGTYVRTYVRACIHACMNARMLRAIRNSDTYSLPPDPFTIYKLHQMKSCMTLLWHRVVLSFIKKSIDSFINTIGFEKKIPSTHTLLDLKMPNCNNVTSIYIHCSNLHVITAINNHLICHEQRSWKYTQKTILYMRHMRHIANQHII